MKELVQKIVKEAKKLKDKYTDQVSAPVNYACIFCQSEEEQQSFLEEANKLGVIIEQTLTGPLFKISLDTMAGKLQLLKIRKPDPTRPERGDADFTVSDYPAFKEKYLKNPSFKLIQKDDFEMIELYDKDADVRAYFSNPPLDKQLGLI